MKVLFTNPDPKHYVENFQFNDKKFKINVTHCNGDCLGFNYKCCLSIMIENGTFSYLEDNNTIGTRLYANLYYLNDVAKIETVNKGVVKAFKDFVKKIYD